MYSARWATLSGLEGVDALTQKPDPAHDVRLASQGEDVAADVGIRFLDRVLDLLERDAVVIQLHRVDQHLVLLDGAAEAGHIDHAGHGLERALEHPVLDGLDLVQGVARALRGRSGRSRRSGSRARAPDSRPAGRLLSALIRLITSWRAFQ